MRRLRRLCGMLCMLVGLMFLWAGSAMAANCAGYTYTLTNGQTADATQVMSNFNTIMACANGNLAKNGANSDITSLNALSTPISLSQGGTGNTTGQPSGTAGGDLSGSYPNPTLKQSVLPFEFYTFVGGLTGNAWNLAAYVPSTALILTTAKSSCKVIGTGATGSTTYTLKDNGSSIGTAVVSAGGTTCTATITSSPYTVTAGHTLSLVGPATADTTLTDIGMTFGGTRN